MITQTIRSLASATLGLLALNATAHEAGAPLTAENKTYLAQYEAIRAGLAADDLAAAKKAAAVFVATPPEKATKEADVKRIANRLEAGKKLAGAASLKDARDAFKFLSRSAVHLAEGQKGYYRYICPHVPNDEGKWVQTTQDISNPYEGKAMPKCGKALE
jgi:hypothetical protein